MVNAFSFSGAMKDYVQNSGIAKWSDFNPSSPWTGWLDSEDAQTLIANHDTERAGTALLPSDKAFVLANALMLTMPYGTPMVYSSYSWTDKDAGAPNDGDATCSSGSGYLCQHRNAAITGAIQLRNDAGDAAMTEFQTYSSNFISFERKDVAFVAFNNQASSQEKTFSTSLADGSYCNGYDGPVADGKCAGSTVTVKSGSFTATVPSYGGLMIWSKGQPGDHTGSTITSSTRTPTSSTTRKSTTSTIASSGATSPPTYSTSSASRRQRPFTRFSRHF